MGLFDNATNVTIENKEVASIKIGETILYEKGQSSDSNDLIFTITGSSFDNSGWGDEGYSFDYDGNFTIDWGDGTTESYVYPYMNHNYSTSGEHTITVTGGVTQLGVGAFYHTTLSSIIIPDTITLLGAYCFADCQNLESITFEGTIPPTIECGVDILNQTPSTCVIRVPTGSLSAYTSAEEYPDPNTYTYVEY